MSTQGVLSKIVIKTPCSERWSRMNGDDKRRFCARCKKSVYNLSAMSKEEAEQLLTSNGKICVRMYRRRDGTVLTSECGPGRRRRWTINSLLILFVGTVLGFLHVRQGAADENRQLMGKIALEDPPVKMGEIVMGDVMINPTPTPEITPVVPEPEETEETPLESASATREFCKESR